MFKKLSPSELEKLGLSKKSESYRDSVSGQIISKRQYLKRQRAEKGIFESNESYAKKFASGEFQYANERAKKAAVGKTQKIKILADRVKDKLGFGNNPKQSIRYETLNIKSFDRLGRVLPKLIGKKINITAGDKTSGAIVTLSYFVTENSTIEFITRTIRSMLDSGGYGTFAVSRIKLLKVEIVSLV